MSIFRGVEVPVNPSWIHLCVNKLGIINTFTNAEYSIIKLILNNNFDFNWNFKLNFLFCNLKKKKKGLAFVEVEMQPKIIN